MTDDARDLLSTARGLSAGRGICFLDGSPGRGWSLLFRDPAAVYSSKDGRGTVEWADGKTEPADGDPFRRLRSLLAENPGRTAAGYWGYDLRYHLERLPRRAKDDLALPDCRVGIYDGPARPAPECPPGKEEIAGGPAVPVEVSSSFCRREYEAAVRRVLDYIAAGDCYQVNLSQRFQAPLRDEPWALYERLRRRCPAPYSAYLDCGDHQVLSSSPELFLRVDDRQVETRPIKGTRPRGSTPAEDTARASELLASAKDRAELLMIVDLERNDLGKVCDFGSVHVPELYRLESYSSVHHLVATVRGRLRPDVDALECLCAAFPGGSITGAPKIRAMEIIEELEPVRRGIYTGAIGWTDGVNGEWNIAIRTMVVRHGQVYFHAGGGIVADSDPAGEYEETLVKAEGMLRAVSGAV